MKRTIILASISVLCLLQTGWGQVPRTISYQGVLKDAGGNLLDGSYDLIFNLYNSAGTLVWSESHSTQISNGVFSVIIGKTEVLADPFPAPAKLGIVGPDGVELSPRIELTSVPYSIRAEQVLGSSADSNVFPDSGNVGIGTTGPGASLHIETSNQPIEPVIGGGIYMYNSGSTGTSDAIIAVRTSGGSGGDPFISWDIAGDQGMSMGLDNSDGDKLKINSGWDFTETDLVTIEINGNVGIGTTSPGTKLDVAGTVNATAFTGDGSGLSNLPGAGWSLTGNSGTTAGTNYLGTSDNVALDFRVNGIRALRLEPHATSPNVIGGYSGNSVTGEIYGATIGGGGYSVYVNQVTANYGTVGGGQGNTASGAYAAVGGGHGNTASGGWVTIGGGSSNTADGTTATVAGGVLNTASGVDATVGGGTNNNASGWYATVPGGSYNTASGQYSFAAGRRADAKNDGAFVWADATDAGFASTVPDEFAVRATGGFRFLTSVDGSGLRLEPHATSPNVIGGYSENNVTDLVMGATIGGGGRSGYVNQVTANYGTVGGGFLNTASAYGGTVGGGMGNTASTEYATVGGGNNNNAGGNDATIGGGISNTASGLAATIGGGNNNNAGGEHATVPGGRNNTAGGGYSFAAGRRAKANHGGSFVWADSTANADFASTAADQFLIRAAGGVGIGTADPQYELDVIGDIRATGSVYYGGTEGNLDGSVYNKPDYVFEGGYEVMTTEEVEKYLKKEGHLPWMTSVKQEREENDTAVNMTRMAFETVETAENLQLQIIELTKLGKDQQREIEVLQAAVAALRLSSGQALEAQVKVAVRE